MDSKIRILVTEDLKVAQLAAINIFNQLNCKVVIAPTGASALDLIIFHGFDMVFLDIELPDINGFEVSRTIRNLERRNKHLPVVAVTANFFDTLAEKCKAAGIDDYMLKPLTVEAVRHMLNKHIGRH